MVCPAVGSSVIYWTGVFVRPGPAGVPPQLRVSTVTIVQFEPHDVVVVHLTVPLPASQVSPLHDTDNVESSQETEQVALAKAELAMKSITLTTKKSLTMRIDMSLFR